MINMIINVHFITLVPARSAIESGIIIEINETLFLFDCKGTSTARGEQDRFLLWIEKFSENITDLYRQGQLILYNLTNELISIPFFEGIKYISPYQIQNEGIFFSHNVMSTGGYLRFLNEMKDKNVTIS